MFCAARGAAVMGGLESLDLEDVAARIRSREVSCVEVLDATPGAKAKIAARRGDFSKTSSRAD